MGWQLLDDGDTINPSQIQMKRRNGDIKSLISQFGNTLASWKNHEEEIRKLLTYIESLEASMDSVRRTTSSRILTTALTNTGVKLMKENIHQRENLAIHAHGSVEQRLNTSVSDIAIFKDADDRTDQRLRFEDYYKDIGPLILSKMNLDCEAMYNQVKQFMISMDNVCLALQSVNQDAFRLIIDEKPDQYCKEANDMIRLHQLQSLANHHLLEYERKRYLISSLWQVDKDKRDTDDNIQSKIARISAAWGDDADGSHINLNENLNMDTSNLQQELQLAYSLAKKRSSELSALAVDSPEKYKIKLVTGSKAYLAISTILYTSLTIPILEELEEYVQTASKELPSSLFDIKEWIDSLSKATRLRTTDTFLSESQSHAKVALQNELSSNRTEINSIRKANESDLEYLRHSIDAIKAHVINALKSVEVQSIALENNFLSKEIQYKEEINAFKDRLQYLQFEKENALKSAVAAATVAATNTATISTARKMSVETDEKINSLTMQYEQKIATLQDLVHMQRIEIKTLSQSIESLTTLSNHINRDHHGETKPCDIIVNSTNISPSNSIEAVNSDRQAASIEASESMNSNDEDIEAYKSRIHALEEELVGLNNRLNDALKRLDESIEATATKAIKLRHIQDIFLEIEESVNQTHIYNKKTESTGIHRNCTVDNDVSEDADSRRLSRDKSTAVNNRSGIEWDIDEYYNIAVLIQEKMKEFVDQLKISRE